MAVEKKKTPEVVLFTDGACSGNPGPGGWAYILRHPETGRETSAQGSEADTTNNRMELTAAVQGSAAIKTTDVCRTCDGQCLRWNGSLRLVAKMEKAGLEEKRTRTLCSGEE